VSRALRLFAAIAGLILAAPALAGGRK